MKKKEILKTDGNVEFKRPFAADRNFTKYIGKVVDIELDPGVFYKVKVDDIEYDIGISLSFTELTDSQREDLVGPADGSYSEWKNEKIYAVCLSGPSDPEFNEVWAPEFYNSRFFNIVSGIRKGIVDCRFIDILSDMRPMSPFESLFGIGMASCAFSA